MCLCFLLLYRCTLWYRAPELLMCESVYSHKIDEWSVGWVLLEMVIGVPPFRGKSECTCQCSQVTHRNFNSDQLARIFLITGSPSNEMLKRVPCEAHLRGWPKTPRKLERTVEKMLTSDRFRLGGTRRRLFLAFGRSSCSSCHRSIFCHALLGGMASAISPVAHLPSACFGGLWRC